MTPKTTNLQRFPSFTAYLYAFLKLLTDLVTWYVEHVQQGKNWLSGCSSKETNEVFNRKTPQSETKMTKIAKIVQDFFFEKLNVFNRNMPKIETKMDRNSKKIKFFLQFLSVF